MYSVSRQDQCIKWLRVSHSDLQCVGMMLYEFCMHSDPHIMRHLYESESESEQLISRTSL